MKCAALLLALCLAPAAAREGAALKAVPPEGKVRLAEPFTFTVEAELPATWELGVDTASANSEFEIVKAERRWSEVGESGKTELFEVTARAFTLGVSTFPAVAWTARGPGAAGAPPAKTDPFLVEVQGAFEIKEEEDIKDIYPPYAYTPWLLLLLAALAAAAAARLLYKRFSRKSGGALFSRAPWQDARTPYQRARDRLERLAASPLPREGRLKQFYTGLTAVLRFYLQEEFRIEAALMTTADLARELKRTGADLKTVMRTRELLQKADLVKFARHLPEKPEADSAEAVELMMEYNRLAEEARAREAARAAAEAEAAARRAGRRR